MEALRNRIRQIQNKIEQKGFEIKLCDINTKYSDDGLHFNSKKKESLITEIELLEYIIDLYVMFDAMLDEPNMEIKERLEKLKKIVAH